MTPQEPADLAHLRRPRDLMDRDSAQPLDVPAMVRAALMAPAHLPPAAPSCCRTQSRLTIGSGGSYAARRAVMTP